MISCDLLKKSYLCGAINICGVSRYAAHGRAIGGVHRQRSEVSVQHALL